MKPKLLDLFCGAGGCSMGYHFAGFEVVGVDINPQPHYPFEFHHVDALTFPLDGFDVIHASPPCQAYSFATVSARGKGRKYPDLIVPTLERLRASRKLWILENVPNAPLEYALVLCGSQFGLGVRRHRLFQTSILVFSPNRCKHSSLQKYTIFGGNVFDTSIIQGYRVWKDGRKRAIRNTVVSLEEGKRAMGIDWMDRYELSQAIPPAYTNWIGTQMLQYIERENTNT